MKINLETIEKLNPCQDRLDNYKTHYNTTDLSLEEFLNLDNITYFDKVWVVTRLFTKEQNVLLAIKCAESVLHLFEEKYPEDKRPRNAIEAAKTWTIKQDEVSASAAAFAETATYSARYAASSAWAAESAWYPAESAAAADWSDVPEKQQELNLKFMLEVYNETKGE